MWWRRSIWGFFVLAFFIYLAASSGIIPIADPAVEQRMYLPLILVISGGVIAFVRIFLGVSCCLGLLLPQGIRNVVSVVVLMGTCFTFGYLTRERVGAYQSPILLWQDTLAKRPGDAQAHHNLGVLYLTDRNDPQAALPHLQRSRDLWPVHASWWFNMADCQRQVEMHDAAMVSVTQAINAEPDFQEAYNCLGICLPSQSKSELEEQVFVRTIELGEEKARFNLALLYLKQQSPAAALQQLERLSERSVKNFAAAMQARLDGYRPDQPLRDNGLDQDGTYQDGTDQDGVMDREGE